MPVYEFRCPDGHVTERQLSMSDEIPSAIVCPVVSAELDWGRIGDVAPDAAIPIIDCPHQAVRVWSPLAAIHFKGGGFYSTDVRGRQERRRRPNPGDDLYKPHDPDAARIARSL